MRQNTKTTGEAVSRCNYSQTQRQEGELVTGRD